MRRPRISVFEPVMLVGPSGLGVFSSSTVVFSASAILALVLALPLDEPCSISLKVGYLMSANSANSSALSPSPLRLEMRFFANVDF